MLSSFVVVVLPLLMMALRLLYGRLLKQVRQKWPSCRCDASVKSGFSCLFWIVPNPSRYIIELYIQLHHTWPTA